MFYTQQENSRDPETLKDLAKESSHKLQKVWYDIINNICLLMINNVDLYEWSHCTDHQINFVSMMQAYHYNAMKIICNFMDIKDTC